jgi:tetratricopeptide (TPR) repeat protein
MKTMLFSSVCTVFLFGGSVAAQEPNPAEFLNMVQSYLVMLEQMREIVSDPRSAILMAQNSMKDVYEKEGRKSEAIDELSKILDGLNDAAVRTAVRFSLADLYKETGQNEKALEQLREIVAENKAVLTRR